MQKLKKVLDQNHSKKTKAEIVTLLSSLSSLISKEEYEKVTGIEPSELSKVNKEGLLGIMDDFRESYDSNWEKAVYSTTPEILKVIFDQIVADEDSFTTLAASDSDFAAELGSLDFSVLLGGPLDAAVTAQANASVSTVDFIRAVGFDDEGEIRMVDFSHSKKVPNPNLGADPTTLPPGTDVTTPILTEEVAVNVPFISVVNVPSLRIENLEVNFNVKLNSVFKKDISTSLGVNASVGGGFGPIKFKVSTAFKRSSSTGIKVEKQYTLGVKMVATNDEMPAGLESVLNLLSA